MNNQQGFRNTPQYKRGKFGEDIVRQWLSNNGYITYSPDQNCAHLFDGLASKPGQLQPAYFDVKTKPRRIIRADTGIDIRHYNSYMEFVGQGLPFFLAFVDPAMGCIYTGNLEILAEQRDVAGYQYPLRDRGKIYFPLGNIMPHITVDYGFEIVYIMNNAEVETLRDMETTRATKYDYTISPQCHWRRWVLNANRNMAQAT